VRSKFIEVSQGGTGNWGKFMLARFTEEEWARGSALPEAASLRSLLAARGWAPNHLLFVDLETGEGALLAPGGSAPADLEKHRIWVCPMAEPFLEWLYQEGAGDLDALPSYVELPDAEFAMTGYRRRGPSVAVDRDLALRAAGRARATARARSLDDGETLEAVVDAMLGSLDEESAAIAHRRRNVEAQPDDTPRRRLYKMLLGLQVDLQEAGEDEMETELLDVLDVLHGAGQ